MCILKVIFFLSGIGAEHLMYFVEIVEDYIFYLRAGDRVFALRMLKKRKTLTHDTLPCFKGVSCFRSHQFWTLKLKRSGLGVIITEVLHFF